MDIWVIVGVLGIVFTSCQLIPQLVKTLRTRKVRDMSYGLAIIVGCSAFTWLVYGIHLRDFAVVAANSINFVGAVALLIMKVAWEQSL